MQRTAQGGMNRYLLQMKFTLISQSLAYKENTYIVLSCIKVSNNVGRIDNYREFFIYDNTLQVICLSV